MNRWRDPADRLTVAAPPTGLLDFRAQGRSRPAALAALCAFALLVPHAVLANEAEPLYRVEAIAFVHLDGQSDRYPVESLRDFNGLVDPLRLLEAQRQAKLAFDAFVRLQPGRAGDHAGEAPDPESDWPTPWLAQEALSPGMEDVRRRLENDTRYEVLAWRSWHQPVEQGRRTPRIRFHDQRVIDEHWPEAERPPPASADHEAEPDPAGAAPRFQHALDGSIRLVRRQFLRIELDLELRQAATRFLTDDDPEGRSAIPSDWVVHRLHEARAVRAGRLEYFDSSWLGLLILIERLDPPPPEALPAPQAGRTEQTPDG